MPRPFQQAKDRLVGQIGHRVDPGNRRDKGARAGRDHEPPRPDQLPTGLDLARGCKAGEGADHGAAKALEPLLAVNRGDLRDHPLAGIRQIGPHCLDLRLGDDGASRTDAGALAAEDALDLPQVVAESGRDAGGGTTVGEVDGADALHLAADADAIAAEHALVGVANQAGIAVVHTLCPRHALEADLVHSQTARQVKQLAGGALAAGGAALVVVGQQ